MTVLAVPAIEKSMYGGAALTSDAASVFPGLELNDEIS